MAHGMVFLDESGHFANTDYMCLAGFMSDELGWTSLCQEWRVLLREKWKVPAIHMREIMSPKGKSPAASWDTDKKVSMLRDFIHVIRKHTRVGFGCAIDAKHYREVVKVIEGAAKSEGLKSKPFKAQVFCMARVVKLIIGYLDESKASEDERKTSLVFDDDEQYSKACYGLLCELKKRVPVVKETIVNISFADDLWYYPLQAADLLSYASCNELKKGSMAWQESNVFTDLLKDEDPAYGKLYCSEKWTADDQDTKALMEAIIRETVEFQGQP